MRYDITAWTGGQIHQMSRTWGRRRAQRVADEAVEHYRRQSVADYEVQITPASGEATMLWYFSAARERDGDGPLLKSEMDEIRDALS